jgi:hypothetical protein
MAEAAGGAGEMCQEHEVGKQTLNVRRPTFNSERAKFLLLVLWPVGGEAVATGKAKRIAAEDRGLYNADVISDAPMIPQRRPWYRPSLTAQIMIGLVVSLVSAFTPIDSISKMVNIGTLLAFVIVCVGVMVLRYARPNIPRPFRTPLVPIVPILGILICGYMMYSLPSDTWTRLVVWMVVGLAIYFLYGKRNSRIGNAEPVAGD